MVDINTLKNSYFFQSADAQQLPGAPVPQTFSDSKITPVIDCARFNQEIMSALKMVGKGADAASNAGDFVFIANWWLGLSGGTFQSAKFFGPGLQVLDGQEGVSGPYALDGPQGTKVLLDMLKELAQRGVDVRVMGWVSLGIMDRPLIRQWEKAKFVVEINALTVQSIKDLREEPELEKKVVMSTIAHAAGSVHTKCVIIGTNSEAIGFTGGLDLQMGRWAHVYHDVPKEEPRQETWHDIVAKIEGPAVVGLYDWYKDLWNENVSRPPRHIRFEGNVLLSHMGDTEDARERLKLRAHTFQTSPKGKHHVQNLRTVPQLNYKPVKLVPTPGPITFAPNGLFEFRYALKKAIENAQTYIYMEDQAFWSREVMEWINVSILKRPQLRVILLLPGAADPNDPKLSPAVLCNSINKGLLKHANQNEEDRIKSQVRMFRRIDEKFLTWFSISTIESGRLDVGEVNGVPVKDWRPSSNGPHSKLTTNLTRDKDLKENFLADHRYEIRAIPQSFRILDNEFAQANTPIVLYVGNIVIENPPSVIVPAASLHELVLIPGIIVHSKTTLVDDHWAVIGSASIMRRSLYTDFDHGVSFLDEDDLLIKEYRKLLWDDHFRHGIPAHFDDIQEALHAWEVKWGKSGAAPTRPPQLEELKLPIAPEFLLAHGVLSFYNKYQDPDSREKW